MTVNELITKVMQAHPAIHCYLNKDNNIEGNYRAKKSTTFCLDTKKLEFIYNNAGTAVSSAFEPFLLDAKKAREVQRLLNEDNEQ